jgi:hypothetical protein
MNLPRQASIRQEWRQLIRISSVMWQVERFLPKEVAADALSYAVQARYVSIRKRPFFECFPYVCPEPVLVK